MFGLVSAFSPMTLRLLLSMLVAGSFPLVSLAGPKSPAPSEDLKAAESEYYRIITLPTPEGVMLEAGALCFAGPGKLACATRIGDIWIADGVLAEPPQPKWTQFASGLHEVLGLAYKDGCFYEPATKDAIAAAGLHMPGATPESGSRVYLEAKKIPELLTPSVYFPYPVPGDAKMGHSTSGFAFDATGRFGPFKNQLFAGDQSDSTVMRVFLEKVQGHYQGACFPFKAGFDS